MEIVGDIAKIFFLSGTIVVLIFAVIYALTIAWNIRRTILDEEHSASYYFSRKGPKN